MKKIKVFMVTAIVAITFVTKTEAQKEPPPPPPNPKQLNANSDVDVKMDMFLEAHPAVASMYWETKTVMVVKLKTGNVEKYNMADGEQKKSFDDKYGDVAVLLPPPPPPPPPPHPKA